MRWPLRYYSPERLWSAEARASWVEFDGERTQWRLAVAFSLPRLWDVVWRRDVDSVEEGVLALWRELQAMDRVPGGQLEP